MLPCVEQMLAQISGAKMFSKLDANSGFWQIKLSEPLSPLRTFITLFLFSKTSIWDHFCTRDIPEANV